jgi:hypothetical protein
VCARALVYCPLPHNVCAAVPAKSILGRSDQCNGGTAQGTLILCLSGSHAHLSAPLRSVQRQPHCAPA